MVERAMYPTCCGAGIHHDFPFRGVRPGNASRVEITQGQKQVKDYFGKMHFYPLDILIINENQKYYLHRTLTKIGFKCVRRAKNYARDICLYVRTI